jgi:hypothetical protein
MEVSGQPHVPAALSPGKNPGTYLIGGWAVPRVSLDSLALAGIGTFDRPARRLVAIPTRLSWLHIQSWWQNKLRHLAN